MSLPASVGSAVATADEVHYTFTGPTSVAFDWRGTATDIRYGLTTSYGNTATASTPAPLPYSSAGPFQEAELTGLTPGTTYHYSIGGEADQTFVTAPNSAFRFDVEGDIGDSGSYGDVTPTQAQIAADKPAFVLGVGDLTYGNAHGQAAVDQHFNDVMVWSEQAAYMPAWGNHEWESTDDLRNYKGRFDVPNAQTSATAPAVGCCGEDWGWFDAGDVRFISYPEPYTSSTWQEWQASADAVFANAQADPSMRFIVTYGHRPAYSTGHHPGAAALAGILDSFGDRYPKYVLNLNGHSHDYERFQPIHGVTHITSGGGGATLETPWTSMDPRTVVRAMHLEHLRIDVSDTAMRIEAVCGPPTSNDDIDCLQGSVIDSYTIGTTPTPPAPPALDYIVISPASGSITAGGSQTYTAEGFDTAGNSLGDVTASTVFSIGPDGSCSGNDCTAKVAGVHTVTGDDAGQTGVASLIVTAGPLDHLMLSPASASIPVGGSQAYTAEARDEYDNSLGEVTGLAGFSIAPDGSCTASTCTASVAGEHTVTASLTGASGSASLQVKEPLDHIVVSPGTATVSPGGSQAFTSEAFDGSGNSLGDVTASTVFSIEPDGSCNGNVCTANVGGPHTVTGNDAGKTNTATLAVSFVKNRDFETDTSGWSTAVAGVELGRVAGGHTGDWAAQVMNTGTSTAFCRLNDSPNWVKPAVAGTYTGSIWVRADTPQVLTLRFREYSLSNGDLVGSAASQITLTTEWQPVTVTYPVATAGTTLDFNAYIGSAPPGICFYADDATIFLR